MFAQILAAALVMHAAALDATEQQAITMALRATKMSEHDLSFKKDHVESELVLREARAFLQQPLALLAYGQLVLFDLRGATNLVVLSEAKNLGLLGRRQESLPPRLRGQADKSSSLPPAIAEAVRTIYDAAAAIQPLLPKPDKAAFDAFALETFRDDREQMDIAAELLRRHEALELQDDELANALLDASDRFDREALMTAFQVLVRALEEAVAGLQTNECTEAFEISTDTPLGMIIVGGAGRNVYTNEAFLIIDVGGDDLYENSAAGAPGPPPNPGQKDVTYVTEFWQNRWRPVSIVIDLAGNDRYVCRQGFSQGAGVFGIGILVDCGGDDVYEARHLSQGAGFFGCGLLADYGGRDKFVADTFAQGAAMFGAGILWQRGGDTSYRAAQMAQGFGGTEGYGLLLEEAGQDAYFAGGKYPCGWLPGQNFSLSQGFGYGMRPFAGGGIGILCDLKGDDHYTADVYGQGASYWYAVGLLLDAAGNDSYEAHQYCQGAGIHLSSGALVDWAGNDSYTAGHICQGAAHDYSVGMLMDRGGDDKYSGDTTAQGAAINNSFAMLLDRSGSDQYVGKDPKQSQAAGHDGGKRQYGSIALLLDLGGDDHYSQGQTNNMVWLKPWYGVGMDRETAKGRIGETASRRIGETANGRIGETASRRIGETANGRIGETASRRIGETAAEDSVRERPERASRPERRPDAVVDVHHPVERLLRRAISDRPDAGKAWDELRHLGAEALPYLLTRLDSPNVLVRVKVEELVDHLGTNAVPLLIAGIESARNDEVARLCAYFLARFDEKARAAIPHVLPLLEREKTRATALYTLGHLRARQAFEPAMAALADPKELVRLRAAQALGRIGERRAIPKLIAALEDELWTVRYAAQDALVAIGKPSIGPLRKAYAKASARARPHIIEALAKLGERRALVLARQQLRGQDPLVRLAIEKALKEQVESRHD